MVLCEPGSRFQLKGGEVDERLKKVIYVNEDGNLVIPKELSRHYGLEPGAELVFEQTANTILLRRPITHLARIDIEPTNNCNLTCSTCIRNVWDAPTGWMKENTYRQILAGVKSCDPIPTIFFGGYGEPLSHPDIIGMIQEAKALGARVELITNGTLLNEECIHTLIDVGLDFLWVSIDGASSAGYADVRLEDALSTVKGNIENLHRQRLFRESQLPQLGLSFVAMKKNIEELTDIVTLGIHNDARKLSVSNVLPHTEALKNEMLYERSGCGWRGAYYELQFPRFDISDSLHGVLRDLIFWFGWNGISGNERERRRDRCPSG
jgi:organic radical activating enzyme